MIAADPRMLWADIRRQMDNLPISESMHMTELPRFTIVPSSPVPQGASAMVITLETCITALSFEGLRAEDLGDTT